MPDVRYCIRITFRFLSILMIEVKPMKEDEKKSIPWEIADPKPPVIQSGHMENRVRNHGSTE